ncbi:hypothetical protein TRE132_00960 [Pseudomonas chlororaphis subsp. aurantiaca]|nr:hypothetical protein TRE132_00960 [Pseudomonas chlororaphis subsp. aurantiaca]
MVENHHQAAVGGQIDHIGQVPARRRHAKVAAPEHQRRTVFVGFGGGVQPVLVGRAADIRRPHHGQVVLAWPVGAGLGSIDVGRLINEAITETDLLQGRDHLGAAFAQGLRLEHVQAFAQLAEQLLQAFEKALALGIHLLAFAQLRLVHRNAQARRQQQDRTQYSRARRQQPGAIEPTAQGFAGGQHHWISEGYQ